ncbi:hypothetical protein [Rickettsia hoogstraalii]|nr:hypothetical protein [Rickettsia hoogstraalii]
MRGNYEVIDEAISRYLTRLPRSLRLLAMMVKLMHASNTYSQ